MLTTIERKALFTLTRGVALIVILGIAAWVGITVSDAVKDRRSIPPTSVSTADLLKEVTSNQDKAKADQNGANQTEEPDNLTGLKIPPFQAGIIAQLPNTRRIFSNMLKDILPGDRQAFLDDMNATVGPLDTQYHLPIQKLGEGIDAFVHKRAENIAEAKEAEEHNKNLASQTVIRIGSGLALIALFSLVLVLLAIERNTRPSAG